ncbi:hypothetical protein JB92DRAFT_2986645, partial [Gautieria morchelliformis]
MFEPSFYPPCSYLQSHQSDLPRRFGLKSSGAVALADAQRHALSIRNENRSLHNLEFILIMFSSDALFVGISSRLWVSAVLRMQPLIMPTKHAV